MTLEPHEIEILLMVDRSCRKGITRGIETKNGELLDFMCHIHSYIQQLDLKRDRNSIGRVADSYSEGCGFDSHRSHQINEDETW